MADPRTPVTVVTGLSGAEKMAWIRRAIERGDRRRAVVLTADAAALADTGVLADAGVLVIPISHHQGPPIIGCACCAVVQGDPRRTLRDLLPRARRGDIDRVIIDAGNDPCASLTTDPVLASVYRVEKVAVVGKAPRGRLIAEAVRSPAAAG
jgi:G3E family GTPase